jgi:hypothetical protein
MYTHDRARADAATQLGKNIASGEKVDTDNIQVRYSR